MFFMFDILEQFDLYAFFHVDMLDFSVLVVFFFVVTSLFLLYDISTGCVFFVFVMIFFSVYYNTINFILAVIFWCVVNVVYECLGPVIAICYFWMGVISDAMLKRVVADLGGKLNTYYFFLVGTAIILGSCNLLGIIPYSKALTTHFIFAFYFSLTYFIVNVMLGLYMHSIKLFNLFLADDIPLFLVPLMVCIEIISFFSRIFSLSIRLFANLVAGHILLKILMVFLHKILVFQYWLGLPSFILYLGILIIITLEFIINILQVYIFNLLLIMYINNMMKLH